MKRCSHARFPRRKSHGALSARRLESKGDRNHTTEALELIAKAFGYENWNNLSAKIEEAEPPASERPSSTAAQNDAASRKTLYCSFCGKSQHEVRTLVAGPSPSFIWFHDQLRWHALRPY
jgi:hypothetical protein